MTDKEIIHELSEVFPNPTLWIGQRLKLRQVELLNAIAVEFEKRKMAFEDTGDE